MGKRNDDALLQLNALNEWLGEVFGQGTRMSTLLAEAGLSKDEVEVIKTKHLAYYV